MSDIPNDEEDDFGELFWGNGDHHGGSVPSWKLGLGPGDLVMTYIIDAWKHGGKVGFRIDFAELLDPTLFPLSNKERKEFEDAFIDGDEPFLRICQVFAEGEPPEGFRYWIDVRDIAMTLTREQFEALRSKGWPAHPAMIRSILRMAPGGRS